MSFRALIYLTVAMGVAASTAQAQRLDLAWPTPNTAFRDGRSIETFIQPTESGEVTSGLFGCVRTSGSQFHEGLDLYPVARNRQGEATDKIFAALSGVVRHISTKPGDSSYGRYIVLEHPDVTPAIYTLYAHLSVVESGLKVGDRVATGQTIATMGRSAGGYTIPKERAHLHFEFGLRMTENFSSWYSFRKFGSPNVHGLWNGMNLVGFDPLDFFTRFRAREVNNFREYLALSPAAVTFRIAAAREPDFIRRYPDLLTKPVPASGLAGWEVKLNPTGLPYAWTPLTAADVTGMAPNAVRITQVDTERVRTHRCKQLVTARGTGHIPARDLTTLLQLVFGLR